MGRSLQFHIGQRLRARVLETVATKGLIISINGELLRVENKTGQKYAKGDYCDLEVIGTHPIKLRLLSRSQRGKDGHWGISI